MGRLPEMQEAGMRLSRAREARRLLALRAEAQVREREYAEYQRVYDTATAAAREAAARGDADTEAHERGIARSYAELIAVRTAPLRRAQQALVEAEESSPFAIEESRESTALDEAALDEASFVALEQDIADYQRDYEETYALCQALDARS
jgi:hypothetical protein